MRRCESTSPSSVAGSLRATTLGAALFLPVLVPAQDAVPLVSIGDEWSYFRGTEEPSPDQDGLPTIDWTDIEFDDSGWDRGPTGIGYGDADDATVLDDMADAYASVYLRRVFEVDDPNAVSTLGLIVDYDDGFVAYLNGFEVARSGLVGMPPPFTEFAASHEAGTAEVFELDPGLLEDENVLSIQVHNTTIGSSDLSCLPELVSNRDICPPVDSLACTFDVFGQTASLSWTSGAFYDRIEVRRDGTLIDDTLPGDATSYVDLSPPLGETVTYEIVASGLGQVCLPLECEVSTRSLDGAVIAEGDTWAYFRGSVAPPDDWFEKDFDDDDWEFGPTGIGYGDGDDRTELLDMQDDGVQPGYLAVFCRHNFSLAAPAEAADLVVRYDDGVVIYLDGVELTRANMDPGLADHLTAAPAAAPEPSILEFSIDPALLGAGTHTLAASVHNTALTSSDLSFIPVLLVTLGGEPVAPRFRRGDTNSDSRTDLADAVNILVFLFQGGAQPPCRDAADVDDNGQLNLTDSIGLLQHLFQGGPAPPPPGFACGVDPTPDAFGDCETAGCN